MKQECILRFLQDDSGCQARGGKPTIKREWSCGRLEGRGGNEERWTHVRTIGVVASRIMSKFYYF